MTTETEPKWEDAAGEVSSRPPQRTYPQFISRGKRLLKVRSQMEFIYNRTVITKRGCRCYGCGVAHPLGSRMSNVGAIKILDGRAECVTLYFCRICREIGRSMTDAEWRALQPGQLRRAHRDEWAALHRKHNPSEEGWTISRKS